MRGIVSLLAVAVIVLLSYKFYFSKMVADTGTASPVQTIDVVGVKNDLISIAEAERTYQAQNGSYASMDELVSSGALTMRKNGRDGYTYEIETSGDGFQVVANCPSAKFPGCSNYAIDQTMEVHTESN